MQIVHELGGIPLRAAYTLIKAISKKKESVINANRPKFIAGAAEKGLNERAAEELFDLILKFAGYGFNKSHSTGYAIVAYQTAFLKTYFPNQYMAAFLTYESQAQKVEDWIRYKDDCRHTVFVDGSVGVDVRPPDINLSDADFTVVFDDDEMRDGLHGHVRFGLKALKGVGGRAIDAIVEERGNDGTFRSLHDFCERVPPGVVNKATIEALVLSGAFDSVHGAEARSSMVATIEGAVAAGQSLARDRAAGQGALFGGEESPAEVERFEPALVRVPSWDEQTTLQKEKEVLGFYVSSHPLDRWRHVLERFGNTNSSSIGDVRQDRRVLIGGMIKSVRPVTTRKGDRMAIMTFEDMLGEIDSVLFPRTYSACAEMLKTDSVVFLEGTVDHSRGDTQVQVERIIPVEQASTQLATALEVCIDASSMTTGGALEMVAGALRSRAALGGVGEPVPVRLRVVSSGRCYEMECDQLRVTPVQDLLNDLCSFVGESNVRVLGGRPITEGKRDYRRNGRASRERQPAVAAAG